jgi:hypothetical protein
MRIVIPGCPDAVLSPNSRSHWRVKATAVARARQDAYYATIDRVPYLAQSEVPVFETGKIIVRPVIGWGKGRKRMDGDNALAC